MIGNVHWKRYLRSIAGWPIGLSGHGLTLTRDAGAQVLAREQVAVAAGVDDVGIVGARRDVTRLAAARLHPISDVDAARLAARAAQRGVVLLRAADRDTGSAFVVTT